MSYDVYLRYSDNAVVRTREVKVVGAHTSIMVDLDAEGEIVGVEALDVDTVEVDGKRAQLMVDMDESEDGWDGDGILEE